MLKKNKEKENTYVQRNNKWICWWRALFDQLTKQQMMSSQMMDLWKIKYRYIICKSVDVMKINK